MVYYIVHINTLFYVHRRVHISADTLACLNGTFEVEPGEGGSRDPYIKEHELVTHLIKITEEPRRLKKKSRTGWAWLLTTHSVLVLD